MGTVREAVARGAAVLDRAGCDTPRLDAELLLAEVLGVGRARLVIDAREALAEIDAERFDALLARREAREPVAYILGRRDFRRLTLTVARGVLIPRPESELLVEVGLALPRGARVADVGTGSGAIALALKDERPDLEVTGIEIDERALSIARSNGDRLGLDVCWKRADLLDDARYDAVLANLPYVEDRAILPPEISLYEPSSALFAGADGLDVIRRLVSAVGTRMEVAVIGLEIGTAQAGLVSACVGREGFRTVTRLSDLAGHERVIVGRR